MNNSIQGHLILPSLSGAIAKLTKDIISNHFRNIKLSNKPESRVFNNFKDVQVTAKFWTRDTAGVNFHMGIQRYGQCPNTMYAIVRFPQCDETKPMKLSRFRELIAYALHELCHVLFTKNLPWDTAVANAGLRATFLGSLINGLEDPRIEKAGIDLCPNVNFSSFFESIINTVIVKAELKEDDFKNIPFVLAVFGRRLNGYKINVNFDWDLCPWRAELEKALKKSQSAKSTKQIVKIALELDSELDKFRQPQQSDEESDESGKESGDESGESGESGVSGKSGELEESQESDESGESQDESQESSGESQESGESDESQSDVDNQSGKPAHSGESNECGKPYGENDYPEIAEIQVDPFDKIDTDDLEPLDENQNHMFDLGDPSNQFNTAPHQDILDKKSLVKDLSSWNDHLLNTECGSLKNALWKLVKAQDKVGRTKRETKGKFDRKNLRSICTGDVDVFYKRTFKKAENTAVSIFVDTSDSMGSNCSSKSRQYAAEKLVVNLSDILGRTSCEFAVQGFSTTTNGDLSISNFKGWNEKLTVHSKKKIADTDLAFSMGTPAYESIRWAIHDLSLRNTAKKILFIISDACFDGAKENYSYLEQIAENLGIKIALVGIRADNSDYFKNSVNLDNPKDLFSTGLSQLVKSLGGK